ncbi:MAG: hypothetical protein CXT78_03610 [Thaumarchaeota archaeon]|nr:MAG: hypothetical protein CXT78_03610 [Nitrososphaerota archaeon]
MDSPKMELSLMNQIENEKNHIVLPLNYELEKNLKSKNIKIISEENILDLKDYYLIDDLTMKLSRTWYNNQTNEKLFFEEIDISKLLSNEIYQIFLRIIHRIILLQKVIKKTNPKIIKINNFDEILNEISIEICNYNDMKIEIINKKYSNQIENRFDKINFSIKLFGKNREIYVSKKIFNILKNCFEKYWDLRYTISSSSKEIFDSNKKSILLLDFNLTLDESFIHYLYEKKYNILLMNNRRPIIWNNKSLEIAKKIRFEKIDTVGYKIEENEEILLNMNKLIKKYFNHDQFTFSSIELGKYFMEIILKIIKKRLPEIILKIEYYKKLIKDRKIDGVWVLDDFGDDKVAVNVFQNSNIPVGVFLAGNLTSQWKDGICTVESFVIDRTGDKLIIWGGNDYKNCVESKVNLEKIEIGGAPRYEKFNKIITVDNNYILILTGAFPSTAWSLFLSSSFIIEFENKVNQVFLELKKFNKKIILKRHPTQGKNEIINYEKMLLKIIPDAIVLKESNTTELISKATLVIATPSTVVEETILLNKPIILIPYIPNNNRIPYASTGAVIEINDENTIYEKIKDCLFNEKIKDELAKGRKRFIQKVFNNINYSSEQHNEIMLKLISDKNSTK